MIHVLWLGVPIFCGMAVLVALLIAIVTDTDSEEVIRWGLAALVFAALWAATGAIVMLAVQA